MDALNNSKAEWQHPIANSLLSNYESEVGILDIIDLEAESLLNKIRKNDPKIFSPEDVLTPIEKIARALNVDLAACRNSGALGTAKVSGAKIQFAINTENQHYFRQRFTVAHELGHVCLSQLAGPLTYREIARAGKSSYEEEFLCDLFGSALLMPLSTIKRYLEGESAISLRTINGIAKDFKVSKGAVLRRIACVKRWLLLFWGEIENPLTEGSDKAERIVSVYPNISQLSNYFIPLYCTAHGERFEPNLILESLEKEVSISGDVLIRNLGSLPEGNYHIHNVFFRRWSKDADYYERNYKPKYLYDMSTFIELKSC
jgi:Zn-dependent peptidase ImmA (M78 family)